MDVERRGATRSGFTRRAVLGSLSALLAPLPALKAAETLRFGLTPVFLSDDLQLLADLKAYLETATGSPVELVTRRTYQEITALLVAGQLDAAWICGFPYVAFRDRLTLAAVPLWKGKPLYQSYLIAEVGRSVAGIGDLAGDLHAYSDPDSNSGFLVTQALLAERGFDRGTFFRRAIFTYGHRNVVRAVAAGLAQSGSVDGYVLEVLTNVEPELTRRVEIVRRSEWLGFPPIAAPRALEGTDRLVRIREAFTTMASAELGRRVLATLQLDGFVMAADALFDPIAEKVALVGSHS